MLIYIKNTYILKLLLNVVTARLEALILGNTFLYARVKELFDARELSHVLTPSINSSLLLQLCDSNQFFR
jgi:hypothetical protein